MLKENLMLLYHSQELTNCGVRAVFRGDDKYIYTLNEDNTATKVHEGQKGLLAILFPSASNPKDIRNAMFKYACNLVKCGNTIDIPDFMGFDPYHSVVRLYKDIFLVCYSGWGVRAWILLRILVP